MKKTILLSLSIATLFFTACGEDTKKTVKETSYNELESAEAVKALGVSKMEKERLAQRVVKKSEDVTATLKEKTEATIDTVRETTSSTANSVKEMASTTREKAEEVIVSAKEAVSAENPAGKAAFAKCAGCHGANGKTKALGKSAIIAGQSAADLEVKLTEYKAGTRNVAGMGMLMKGQVTSMDEAGIKAVSEYISGL